MAGFKGKLMEKMRGPGGPGPGPAKMDAAPAEKPKMDMPAGEAEPENTDIKARLEGMDRLALVDMTAELAGMLAPEELNSILDKYESAPVDTAGEEDMPGMGYNEE
jgi:hypothetical protein